MLFSSDSAFIPEGGRGYPKISKQAKEKLKIKKSMHAK